MEIDHIFIFSSKYGKEADSLVDFGLIEGSNRLHPGQGTTNRKFYFDNFFLEVLWVINENEIKSKTTSPTKLWERSQFKNNDHSPYGLCFINSKETDALFENSEKYQPDYFPREMVIDMITNEEFPELPWTFRLPYRGEKKVTNEPKEHPNNIKSLTKTTFEIKSPIADSEFINHFKKFDNIHFNKGYRSHLILEFDHKIQGKEQQFPELALTIQY